MLVLTWLRRYTLPPPSRADRFQAIWPSRQRLPFVPACCGGVHSEWDKH